METEKERDRENEQTNERFFFLSTRVIRVSTCIIKKTFFLKLALGENLTRNTARK